MEYRKIKNQSRSETPIITILRFVLEFQIVKGKRKTQQERKPYLKKTHKNNYIAFDLMCTK